MKKSKSPKQVKSSVKREFLSVDGTSYFGTEFDITSWAKYVTLMLHDGGETASIWEELREEKDRQRVLKKISIIQKMLTDFTESIVAIDLSKKEGEKDED
jgi:hypothetical protein